MDAQTIHEKVVSDYENYIKSFINISDEEIRGEVLKTLDEGKLWPDPLFQFNPSFEKSVSLSDLVEQGLLHNELKNVFHGYSLYRHQKEAIELGASGKDFIVTSGTGSGKSLTYIGTIFNKILSNPAEGIRAIIVYPMNALINSQSGEINKYAETFEGLTGKPFPIKTGQYTGQENDEKRSKMLEEPPNILLTNYMMLELILTRTKEKSLRDSIYRNLEFLVFDELHTYRGRQGADVGMLIRRLRRRCTNEIISIGTSATMVSGGSIEEQKSAVAGVAKSLFGVQFDNAQVINEYLDKGSATAPPQPGVLRSEIEKGITSGESVEEIKNFPISSWLENKIALAEKEGLIIRGKPLSLKEIAENLSHETNADFEECSNYLKHFLKELGRANEEIGKSNPRGTFLPYKLHQFFAQTGSVYISLEAAGKRIITLDQGRYAESESNIPLYPTVFSRESGECFHCLSLDEQNGKLQPREFQVRSEVDEDENETRDGYLIPRSDDNWTWDPIEDLDYLPTAWVKVKKDGSREIEKKYKNRVPREIFYDSEGNFSFDEELEFNGWYMPMPLLFDPTSGTFFDAKTSERAKLASLGTESRSTSTTITTLTTLWHLADHGFEPHKQKFLSFTDNRQDAALQAGHFNDFMQVTTLRSGIYKAVKQAADQKLSYEKLGQAIFDALEMGSDDRFLDFAHANEVPSFPSARKSYEETLQKLFVYRAIYDLRRSWRVVLPNLEQSGLLEIDYADLDEDINVEQAWSKVPFIGQLSSEDRKRVIFNILEYFRLEFALESKSYLDHTSLNENRTQIIDKLKQPWSLNRDEELPYPKRIRFKTLARNQRIDTASAGISSGLGKYLLLEANRAGIELPRDLYEDFIESLLTILEEAGYLISEPAKLAGDEETRVYALRLSKIIWKLRDENTAPRDAVKKRSLHQREVEPNRFFQSLYKREFLHGKRLHGEDHTGQLNNDQRIQRENDFRSGELSALYCSPTMELGIDIADLSVVHMRNAPPNPANYAQRSGRAGRSGQAALVFTYCSNFSSHDRHYFDNQRDLVAGVVSAPKLDLANEELLKTHLHAIALSLIDLRELESSLKDLMEVEKKCYPLKEKVADTIKLNRNQIDQAKNTFREVVSDFTADLQEKCKWFTDEWAERNLSGFSASLNESLERWRKMYQGAVELKKKATSDIEGNLYAAGSKEYKDAERRQYQATRQMDLLANRQDRGKSQLSEFYPYRYFASETFLPGYNFTRLPLRVFVTEGKNVGEYISRSRPIALREYGPMSFIYYNGRKYQSVQLVDQEIESKVLKAKISLKSGYFMFGDQYDDSVCPFTQEDLSEQGACEPLPNLLEMGETRAIPRTRITCEEEERVSRGFQIDTYFSVPGGLSRVREAKVLVGKDPYLNIRFLPAARLVHLNRRWRSSRNEGFLVGLTTGTWKKESDLENAKKKDATETEEIRKVLLHTWDTADALYIEPITSLALNPDGVATLQYALKRAIENYFQIESAELGVRSLGSEKCPNILIYESSEGGLGVLSQFIDNPKIFSKVVAEAYKVCRFDDDDYKAPASYRDLLSYYNQYDHDRIDRFLIKDALDKLGQCTVEVQSNSNYKDYDSHYADMLKNMDPNSSTERTFLDYLYNNGYRLPDSAQKRVQGIYVQPDFFYKAQPDAWIFCDGSPHDDPQVKEDDKAKREAIRNRGDQVLVYHYTQSMEEFVAKHTDIFRKVK